MEYKSNTEQIIKIGGEEIYFRFFDFNPENNYLIVLHGLRADTSRMLPLISILKTNYNVIACDLPGFGKSSARTLNGSYIEFSSNLLTSILREFNLHSAQTALLGLSNGANIIIDHILRNPEKMWAKVVLFAPIFSNKYLSMKPLFRKFVFTLSSNLAKGGVGAEIFTKLIRNDSIFNIFCKIADKSSREDKRILEYEREQWRLMTMQHWGKTLWDFLNIDLSHHKTKVTLNNITFVYPRKDQYLDVTKTIEGFQSIFPEMKVEYMESDMHIPRGDYLEHPEAGASIRQLINKL